MDAEPRRVLVGERDVGLDGLQVALWDDAMKGDTRAVMAILRVIEQRVRLLGLQQVGGAHGWTTMVVGPPEDS